LTSVKVDAFAFLLDLMDAIFVSNVDACLASTKCHDVIVVLLLPSSSSV
jgi:hypothetical protein